MIRLCLYAVGLFGALLGQIELFRLVVIDWGDYGLSPPFYLELGWISAGIAFTIYAWLHLIRDWGRAHM